MSQPPVKVETISSYARRSGSAIELVLRLEDGEAVAGPSTSLRVRGPRGAVSTTAAVSATQRGVQLDASLPSNRLAPGVWRIAVRPEPGAPFRRVQARLLVSRTQPVALLPGPAPRTKMEPPSRRTAQRPPALQKLGSALDRALSRLPETQAARSRAALRKSARRVLG